MNLLKEHGIGERLLLDISNLAITNPDQTCIADDKSRIVPVSPHLVVKSKFGRKLNEIFSKLGIYNILFINKIVGKHSFICKTSTGELIYHDVDKVKGKTIKDSCAVALLYFIKEIKAARDEQIDMIKNIELDESVNGLSQIPEKGLISLQKFMADLKDGKIKADANGHFSSLPTTVENLSDVVHMNDSNNLDPKREFKEETIIKESVIASLPTIADINTVTTNAVDPIYYGKVNLDDFAAGVVGNISNEFNGDAR